MLAENLEDIVRTKDLRALTTQADTFATMREVPLNFEGTTWTTPSDFEFVRALWPNLAEYEKAELFYEVVQSNKEAPAREALEFILSILQNERTRFITIRETRGCSSALQAVSLSPMLDSSKGLLEELEDIAKRCSGETAVRTIEELNCFRQELSRGAKAGEIVEQCVRPSEMMRPADSVCPAPAEAAVPAGREETPGGTSHVQSGLNVAGGAFICGLVDDVIDRAGQMGGFDPSTMDWLKGAGRSVMIALLNGNLASGVINGVTELCFRDLDRYLSSRAASCLRAAFSLSLSAYVCSQVGLVGTAVRFGAWSAGYIAGSRAVSALSRCWARLFRGTEEAEQQHDDIGERVAAPAAAAVPSH